MADSEVQAPAVPAVADTKSRRATSKAAAAKANAPKAKKATVEKKAKSPRAYPSFLEMITDAIATLKERTGSSQHAITKFIEEKQKKLPSNFRKLLLVQLKRLVASGKLVKVKNSYKLSPTRSAPAKKPADMKPKVASSKPKTGKVVAKPKAKVATKPKPKAPVKAKPAVKPKAKPAVKPKAKPTVKPKAKPAVRPKAKPAVRPKAKPAVRPKAKPAVRPKAKSAVKSKPKPKTVAKPAKVAKTAAKTTPGKKIAKKAKK